jgi:hypothetical protein
MKSAPALYRLPEARRTKSPGARSDGPGGLIKTDIALLEKALQSGDVSKAKDAFKQLKDDLQASRKALDTLQQPSVQWDASAAAHTMTAPSGTVDGDGDYDGSTGRNVNLSA